MSRAVRRAAVVVVAVAMLLTAPAAGAQDDEDVPPTPSATLSQGSGEPGDTVQIIGKDWPGQTIVQVELCGNLHLNGSVDCLRANAVTKAADVNGSFSADLVVGTPPTPCPCVISVSTFEGEFPIDLPFVVDGAPTAEPGRSELAVPEFRLLAPAFVDGAPFGARLGLPHERVVAATIRNLGTDPIVELPVTVTYGGGDDPSAVIATRTVEDLAPGEEVEVRATVEVGALASGTSTVRFTAGEGSQAVSESTSLSTFPWLLALLVAIAVIVLTAWLLTRLSRSRRAEPGEPEPDDGPEGPLPYDPAALERDLADELQAALTAVGSEGRTGDPSALAAKLAPSIAATLGARYELDDAATDALEAGLRDELAQRLGARPVPAGEGT